jgi:hypothetical protein
MTLPSALPALVRGADEAAEDRRGLQKSFLNKTKIKMGNNPQSLIGIEGANYLP